MKIYKINGQMVGAGKGKCLAVGIKLIMIMEAKPFVGNWINIYSMNP